MALSVYLWLTLRLNILSYLKFKCGYILALYKLGSTRSTISRDFHKTLRGFMRKNSNKSNEGRRFGMVSHSRQNSKMSSAKWYVTATTIWCLEINWCFLLDYILSVVSLRGINHKIIGVVKNGVKENWIKGYINEFKMRKFRDETAR